MSKQSIKYTIFLAILAAISNCNSTYAMMGILSANSAVIPKPFIDITFKPINIPQIPTVTDIAPAITIPHADFLRNPNPPQVTIPSSGRKKALEKWKRAVERDYKKGSGENGGKGSRRPTDSEHHPNGHPNGKGGSGKPHFQTDRSKLKPNTPQKHFTYPKSVTISPGDTLWGIAK